jgi:hypothetical protein
MRNELSLLIVLIFNFMPSVNAEDTRHTQPRPFPKQSKQTLAALRRGGYGQSNPFYDNEPLFGQSDPFECSPSAPALKIILDAADSMYTDADKEECHTILRRLFDKYVNCLRIAAHQMEVDTSSKHWVSTLLHAQFQTIEMREADQLRSQLTGYVGPMTLTLADESLKDLPPSRPTFTYVGDFEGNF